MFRIESSANLFIAAGLYRRPTGCLVRFQSNSTAISDGGAKKLGNDVCHRLAKVCSQICYKRNEMFERCRDLHSLDDLRLLI